MNYEPSSYRKRPTWHWILLYLLVGGIAYAGFYYYYYSPSVPTPTETKQKQGREFKVEITNTAYSPSSITITVSDTITWTNKGDKPSNVSSNPHPVHTAYPPLNLGGIKPGESKSLQFKETGTYRYHNHLNASQVGTIIVK